MGNVWRVFKRDVLRLLKVPPALVVVRGPAGAAVGVHLVQRASGFWNPYDNTGSLRVCVVNQDVGGSSDLTGRACTWAT